MSKYLVVFLVLLSLIGCAGGSGFSSRSGKPLGQAGGPKTRPDDIAERRIVLAHRVSGETLDIVYFRNGSYDQRALAQIRHLMRDRHVNQDGPIDPELIDFLVDMRSRLGLPTSVVFDILSGYRSRETNAMLATTNANVAKESLHMNGWAVDFRVEGVKGGAIAEIAKTMQRGGVSYYPSDNHLHVDIGNIRTWGKGGPSVPPP